MTRQRIHGSGMPVESSLCVEHAIEELRKLGRIEITGAQPFEQGRGRLQFMRFQIIGQVRR